MSDSIAHGFRGVPGRPSCHSGVFLSETRAATSLSSTCRRRLTSFSSRWSRGRGPRAHGTDGSCGLRAAAINSSGRSQQLREGIKKRTTPFRAPACLARFGGSARPAGRYCPTRGPWATPPAPGPCFLTRPRCPARPRPPHPYKRPAASASQAHLTSPLPPPSLRPPAAATAQQAKLA